MSDSGYSKKPLLLKLGLKIDQRILLIDAPDFYTALVKSVIDYEIELNLNASEQFDFIHIFCTDLHSLIEHLKSLKKLLYKDGTLWISWPKVGSGITTDLKRDLIRNCGLKAGLVDVKICSINDHWSGLKFVFRLKDR